MKKEYTEKIIKIPKYIAEDGTVFESETACLEYERSLNASVYEKLKNELEICDLDMFSIPCCFESWDDAESELRWFRVETKKDIEDIIKAYEHDEKPVIVKSHYLTIKHIGCSKCKSRTTCQDRYAPNAVYCNNYNHEMSDPAEGTDLEFPLIICVYDWNYHESDCVFMSLLEDVVDSTRSSLREYENANFELNTGSGSIKALVHDHINDIFSACQKNVSGDIDPEHALMLDEIENSLASLVTEVMLND